MTTIQCLIAFSRVNIYQSRPFSGGRKRPRPNKPTGLYLPPPTESTHTIFLTIHTSSTCS
ncbi:hypothetical protein [Spirosoma gilvum]